MTNLGNGTYVDTLTISAPIYFVFADGGPDLWNNDWTAFNGTYRYGPAATTTITTDVTYATAKRANDYSYYFTGNGDEYLITFDLDNLAFRLEVIEPQPVIILGDVNDDGNVAINDVTALIDYVLGSELEHFNFLNADVNQDESITITDITFLIDMILSN